MVDVLLLWHMHQPRYVHPLSGRVALPWVRLHAAAGYLDMARALERHPGARVTVNFVPSLIEQIEGMLAGARDDLEIIAEKPADALDEAERRAVLARSFSVRWDRAIEPRRRYAELLAKRGRDGRPEAVAAAAPRFTPAELRDLQCLFLLAWLGFAARQDDPAIEALDAKGKDFDERDKATLLACVRRAGAAVLPAWRALAARGQVELASSPFYHPIVPLLVDSDVARRSRPGDTLPPRFARPDDARAHIRLAQETHTRVFGAPPRGMWPPEGSLSPEAVELYGASGVEWLAGDDETLARSLYGEPAGWPPSRARVWSHGGVHLVFRDRELSDRIGFRYADVPAAQAADDLVAGARASGEDGVVGIFLDGENAWEGYPRRGADFLEALYGRLEQAEREGRAQARTISETVRERRGGANKLPRLHSGSWIDASFRIWIGDSEKNRAWTQLGRARDRLSAAEAATPPGANLDVARRLLLMAEGSDWFWWYGEPFSSAEDPIFDELFRAHLAAAYRALGEVPPVALDEAIGTGGAVVRAAPSALVRPRVDGKANRFWDWHGVAKYDIGRGGAMADSSHPVERAYVGFDHEQLYLRIDPTRVDRRRVCSAHMLLRVSVGAHDTALRVDLGAADGGREWAAAGGKVGSVEVVELALPFAAIGARPRDEVRLWFTLEFAGVAFGRVPRDGVIELVTPWPGWEEENWSV